MVLRKLVPERMPQPGSLRFKAVAAVGSVFSVVFLAQFMIAQGILLRNYNALEQDQVRLNTERLNKALMERLAKLDNSTSDYAQWDDTYQFAANQNPQYLTTGISDILFANLNVNLVVILNQGKKLLVQKGYDLEAKRRVPLPHDLLAAISQPSELRSVLTHHPHLQDKTIGLIHSKEGSILLASRPILNSEGKGPSRGTFIFGRLLDLSEIQNLSETTRQQIQLFQYNDPHLPPDIKAIKSRLQQTAITTQILNEQKIAGYLVLKDLLGQPLLILRSQTDRHIYAQGKVGLSYYFWSTLGIGLLLCLLSLLLLERFVLSRLSRLSQEVTAIGRDASLLARVTLPPGRDELSGFAQVLNQTLDRLAEVQHALKASEERYTLAVQGAQDGIWDWQLATPTVYFSSRWKAILGYADQEPFTTISDWFSRVHPEDLDSLKTSIESHLSQNTPYLEHEHRIQHQDGTYRWVLCRGLAIFESAHQPSRMAGSLTDITVRKLAEMLLARQTAELNRSNQELEQFAYIASHDLQEPLRKIEAFGDRLDSKYRAVLGEQGADYIQRMQNAAQRMRILIQDLLLFSRVATQTRPFIATDLKSIVQEVLSDLEVRIREVNAQIHVADLPAIDADPMQMRQLFQNLIGNALKFQRPGVVPDINIAWEAVSVPLTTDNSQAQPGIRLSIADNGIGFDTKYLDRIFKVFQRLHGRNEYEGTGIGLAICAKIIERHGGQITAQSTPDQGATFLISLPYAQAVPGEAP
jgi:PAS domain S-box-containing protein